MSRRRGTFLADRSLRSLRGLLIEKVLVCPRKVRYRSPVSNYQIFMVPSYELVASEEYCGWKARAVMLDLWPLSSNFGGLIGMQSYSADRSTGPFFAGPRGISCRFFTTSQRLVIFFWRVRMDFHLSYSLFPSGSTSARLTPSYSENFQAVPANPFLTRYSRMSLFSCVRWD